MNERFLTQKDLHALQEILRSELGLEVAGDELCEAAVSCIKFTVGKLLRQANLLNNTNLNEGKLYD